VAAPNAVQIGDLNVSVVSAELGALTRADSARYLLVKVKVTNRSKSPVNFASWGRAKVQVTLKDKQGNFYSIQRPSGDDEISIPAGKSIIDKLVFEPPSPFAQLDLDLPIAGTDQAFQFHTGPGFITQPMTPLEESPQTAVAQTTGAPAPSAPAPADKDSAVRKSIIVEYREATADMRQRSMGMNTNDARNFRRRGEKDLRKKLGEKHKLKPDQVDAILREGSY
jgi:hypothetical protein